MNLIAFTEVILISVLGETIKIPGTDSVESLNVSVATAVILSDYYQKVKFNEVTPRFK